VRDVADDDKDARSAKLGDAVERPWRPLTAIATPDVAPLRRSADGDGQVPNMHAVMANSPGMLAPARVAARDRGQDDQQPVEPVVRRRTRRPPIAAPPATIEAPFHGAGVAGKHSRPDRVDVACPSRSGSNTCGTDASWTLMSTARSVVNWRDGWTITSGTARCAATLLAPHTWSSIDSRCDASSRRMPRDESDEWRSADVEPRRTRSWTPGRDSGMRVSAVVSARHGKSDLRRCCGRRQRRCARRRGDDLPIDGAGERDQCESDACPSSRVCLPLNVPTLRVSC
jgi:hypothetical protein